MVEKKTKTMRKNLVIALLVLVSSTSGWKADAEANPPSESKPQPNPPSEGSPTPAKPSSSWPKYPNPWDYCKVPKWAPYIVKYRAQCWCSLEKFRGCFTEIWAAAFNDFKNVGKQCCEAFKGVDENCHRLMFGRNRWVAYKLRQHCSQFH